MWRGGPPAGQLTFGIVRTAPGARAIETEWQELAEACSASPFAAPCYALAWWEHLGCGGLLVAVVRSGDLLVALAPLHERRVGPLRVARWLGHGLGTVAETLVRPGCEAAGPMLWQSLSRHGRVLQLVESREERSLPSDPESSSGRRTTRVARDRCPWFPLVAADDHLATPARRRLRRAVTVARRRIEDAGHGYRVDVATSRGALDDLLPAVRTLMDAAEAARPKLHFLQPPHEAFTLAYLRDAVAREQAALLVAWVDDRPVSFEVVLLAGDTVYGWLNRFDPDSASWSPGHLLRCSVIDWAYEAGFARFDLLLGADDYKLAWASETYETLEVTSSRPTTWRLAAPVLHGRERLRAAVGSS